MKNSTDGGFDQHYNVQVAVEQDRSQSRSRLCVLNAITPQ